jgi:hypothetical protein
MSHLRPAPSTTGPYFLEAKNPASPSSTLSRTLVAGLTAILTSRALPSAVRRKRAALTANGTRRSLTETLKRKGE